MHFLTPHVEISMTENNDNNGAIRLSSNGSNNDHSSLQPGNVTATTSSGLDIQAIVRPLTAGGSPSSPQSADSNSNVPSSSLTANEAQSSRHMIFENPIKPSISLIPIKQVNFKFLFT